MKRICYQYCAVIGVDGMGAFHRQADTPHLDRIFRHGAVTDRALSMDPTISAENWGAMLLGASPVVHGLTNSIVSNRLYTNRALPSVFARLRRAYPDAYFSSVVNWNPINHGIIEHDVGVDFATADSDEALTPLILERIAKKPKFLFVQFDDVDGAGHAHSYGSENHLRQIERTDGYIGRIYDAYEKAGILEETLFIVTADHGGFDHGHGGYTDGEKYVFLGVRGKGVKASRIGYARTKDIAALVLYALGLEVPPYEESGFSSQIPAGIFPWYKEAYFRPVFEPLTPPSRPTPADDKQNGLFSFADREALLLAMHMDHALSDALGNCGFSQTGTVKFYAGGVSGACAEFGKTGFILTRDLKISEGAFSVAVWLRLDPSLTQGAVICGTKNFSSEAPEPGFLILMKNNDTVFQLFTENDDIDVLTPFPGERAEGWLHLIAVCDKAGRRIRVYHNFKLSNTVPLPEAFCGDSSSGLFAVGSDAGGKRNREERPAIFRMDDLLVFNRALDDESVRLLQTYYGN